MVCVSYFWLYELFIPDICYYHDHEMNPILNIFYSTYPGGNGHPAPNLTNYFLSFFIGGIIGNGLYFLAIKSNK